jgi:hypothetical protein
MEDWAWRDYELITERRKPLLLSHDLSKLQLLNPDRLR